MDDRSLVKVMVSGIGSHPTHDEKRTHLADCVVSISSIKCAFRKETANYDLALLSWILLGTCTDVELRNEER
jgi:hypothetical protein